MLTSQARALATLDSNCSRKKSAALPVCSAISAAITTKATLSTTARGFSRRSRRYPAVSTATAMAVPAPQPID